MRIAKKGSFAWELGLILGRRPVFERRMGRFSVTLSIRQAKYVAYFMPIWDFLDTLAK